MRYNRSAFTLIEVLISIVLLGIILTGLYKMLNQQRDTNIRLFNYLQNSLERDKVISVLYKDILYSDGNITLNSDEFDRICIDSTRNSLYGLGLAKVCWLVEKDEHNLLRVEGNSYQLPLNSDTQKFVKIDETLKHIKLFDIYRQKKSGDILVVAQVDSKAPYTFLVQGIKQPPKPKKRKKKDNNGTKSNKDNKTIKLKSKSLFM